MTPSLRQDIVRNFKPNEKFDALQAEAVTKPDALKDLTSVERISYGIYQRDKAIFEGRDQVK